MDATDEIRKLRAVLEIDGRNTRLRIGIGEQEQRDVERYELNLKIPMCYHWVAGWKEGSLEKSVRSYQCIQS